MSQCMCGGCERCQGPLQPDLDVCPLCLLPEPDCRCFDRSLLGPPAEDVEFDD